ncbi:unnamed protein product [Paramecium sonneborni]|uniref:AIG1-type G domain-containing protein n=1 Tax=Paramecium sonneborni TaxID=65129 RepID=A0A8S1JX51_9CILI|nr:unnamed protein product [Paramecium sonneborni]
MFIKDKIELALYLQGENQQIGNLNLLKELIRTEYDKIISNNILYLYYEIRSIKKDEATAKKILRKLLTFGVESLQILQKMEVCDLEICDLKEFNSQTHLNPDFQSFIYENFMANNLNIDSSINFLKSNKIFTLEEFYKIDAKYVQDNFQLQKYKFLELREEYCNTQKSNNQKENPIKNYKLANQNLNLPINSIYKSSNSLNLQENANNIEDCNVTIQKIQTQVDFIQQSRIIKKIGNISIKQFPNYSEYFAKQPNEIKTILLFGQTGAGKTSLINLILNYHFKIQFEDNFRLIFNDCSNSDKTKEIKTYYIPPFNDKPELLIIDTPGFGSVNDETLSKQILNFLMSQLYITLICFVTPASIPRLSVQEHSVLNYVQQMFGINFVNNCIFTFTFCDQGQPQALQSLTFKGDYYQKESPVAQLISKMGENWWIKLNNQSLLTENSGEDINLQLNQMQWNKNMNSLKQLYQNKLLVSKNVNCLVFKQNQFQINNKLEGTFQYHKNVLIILIPYLEKIKFSFKSHQNNVKQNYQFDIKVLENCKENQQDYAINCNKCQTTCFFPLKVSDSISTFFKFLNNQNQCICSCQQMDHFLERFRYNFQEKSIQIHKAENKKRGNFYNIWQTEIAELYINHLRNWQNIFWKMVLCYINMLNLQYTPVYNLEVDFQALVDIEKKRNMNYFKEITDRNISWILADIKWATLEHITQDQAIEYMK